MPARLVSVRRRADGHLPGVVARYLLGGDLSGLARRALAAPVLLPRRPTAADRLEARVREAEGVEGRARAACSVHGADLVAAWAHAWPGTRPWGWWKFDAREVRRVVGARNLLNGTPLSLAEARAYADARPAHVWYFGAVTGHDGDGTAVAFETEHAYLVRHVLLLPDEAAFHADALATPPPWDAMRRHLDGRAVVAAALLGYPDALGEVAERIGLDLSDFAEHVADVLGARDADAPTPPGTSSSGTT